MSQFSGYKPNPYYNSIPSSYVTQHERYVTRGDWVYTIEEVKKLDKSEYYRVSPGSDGWLWLRKQITQVETVIDISTKIPKEVRVKAKFKVNASELPNLLGFYTPQIQKKWGSSSWKNYDNSEFEALILGKSGEIPMTKQKSMNFERGHAEEWKGKLYTLLKFKDLIMKETGPFPYTGNAEIEYSTTPDFLWEETVKGTEGVGEIKSLVPFFHDKKTDLFNYGKRKRPTTIKKENIPQTQLEMKGTGKMYNLTVYITTNDGALFVVTTSNTLYVNRMTKAIQWARDTYFKNKKPVPKEKHPFEDYEGYDELIEMTELMAETTINTDFCKCLGVEVHSPMFLDKLEKETKVESPPKEDTPPEESKPIVVKLPPPKIPPKKRKRVESKIPEKKTKYEIIVID